MRILDSDRVVKLDDVHVQTVLPGIGRPVVVVNGAYRGDDAVLEAIDEAQACVTIRLTTVSTVQTRNKAFEIFVHKSECEDFE